MFKGLALLLIGATLAVGSLSGCGAQKAWVIDKAKEIAINVVDSQVDKLNENVLAPKFAEIEEKIGTIDTDDDGVNDGVEIENETDPKNASSSPVFAKTATLSSIAQEAFQLSQETYVKPQPPAIEMLDYPADSQPGSVGLVYNESNAIYSYYNFVDKLNTYGKAKPRAGNDHLRFRIYTDANNDGTYDLRTYAAANPIYPAPPINPPIDKNLIPIAGKVLSKFIVGHYQSGYGYPQFFDFNSNGYARFNGFVPQIVGSSYRVALKVLCCLSQIEHFCIAYNHIVRLIIWK